MMAARQKLYSILAVVNSGSYNLIVLETPCTTSWLVLGCENNACSFCKQGLGVGFVRVGPLEGERTWRSMTLRVNRENHQFINMHNDFKKLPHKLEQLESEKS